MKLLASLLLVIGLVGCADSKLTYIGGGQFNLQRFYPMTYSQISTYKVTNADCSNIETIVTEVEQSLKLKGLLYADPTTLTEEDRKYNAYGRTIIWSLRVACANPNRYVK